MLQNNEEFEILIVDDDIENIQLAVTILKRKHYKLCYAQNGNEAIQIALEKNIDLILLDVNMPDIDGFTVCKTLKSDSKTEEIPIIFLTADTNKKSLLLGFRLGAIDYITKPFNHAELLARVNNHLELKSYRDQLKELALRDGLTGLYNHRSIMERIEEEISSANRRFAPLTMIMLDIDHFKKVNDTYGHQFGDEVLVNITNSLRHSFRKEDIIGRYGGEEFIVILPNANIKQAMLIGEKVRSKVEGLTWKEKKFLVTISLGITLLQHGEKTSDFIKRADDHLYKAKNNGRNLVVSDEI